MAWPCFMVESTGRDRVSLRRYRGALGNRECVGGWGYHNAKVPIGERPTSGLGAIHETPHSDERWPKSCASCGYRFVDGDEWQEFLEEILRTADGREFVWTDAPIGAIRRVQHFEGANGWSGPDGRSYMVKLPGGHEWLIDGPSSNGGKWTRSGEPPKLTVSPSILVPGYHGYLRDGVLTDPI